jgi:hypothetical protein
VLQADKALVQALAKPEKTAAGKFLDEEFT